MNDVSKYKVCCFCNKRLEPFETSMVCPELHMEFWHYWSSNPKLCISFEGGGIRIEKDGLFIRIFKPSYKAINISGTFSFDDFLIDKQSFTEKLNKIILLS